MSTWLLVLLPIVVALAWAWASDRRARRQREGAVSPGDTAGALQRARGHDESRGAAPFGGGP